MNLIELTKKYEKETMLLLNTEHMYWLVSNYVEIDKTWSVGDVIGIHQQLK